MSYQNKVQISNNFISLGNIIKREPQNNYKSKTTITKINYKKNSRELYYQPQYQNLNEYRQQRGTRKFSTQANIPSQKVRNSISSTKQNNYYDNKNKITNKTNSWLNKYFIYRHVSLNNYLFKEDFRNAMNKLS